jgi:tetratricopeptide (TPR) repeat protein
MARPGFALSVDSASAVAEICRRLDGLPLAIELAAARTRILSPGELLGRLGHRLVLEGGARDLAERQRTLRATIDWSYQLLDVDEARLFAYLSIFAGGWTSKAAERICDEGFGVEVLDGLESLMDHSLVQRVELYRGLGDRRGLADALNNLAPIPMMTGDLPLARRLAAQARDLWQELGDQWQAALATLALGMSSLLEGANEQALSYFEEFVPVIRARGDRFWLISGLTSMAQAQHFLGRFEQARQNFGEALRLALEANDLASVTIALGPLSNLESAAGDHDRRSGCGPPPRRSSSGSVAAPRLRSCA